MQQSITDFKCSRALLQKKAVLEIGLNNPVNEPMTLDVQVKPNNIGLSGSGTVTLPPSGRGMYELCYAPAVVGQSSGR